MCTERSISITLMHELLPYNLTQKKYEWDNIDTGKGKWHIFQTPWMNALYPDITENYFIHLAYIVHRLKRECIQKEVSPSHWHTGYILIIWHTKIWLQCNIIDSGKW